MINKTKGILNSFFDLHYREFNVIELKIILDSTK
jgi:hypothetical protein